MKDMWVLRLKDEHKEEGMLGDYYHDSSERGEEAEWMWLTQDLSEATLHSSKEAAIAEMKEYEKVMTVLYGPDAMCSYGYTHMMKHFEFVEVEVTEAVTEALKYECDECNQIYETTDQHLIYCDSEKCVDKDVKLHRLHEL